MPNEVIEVVKIYAPIMILFIFWGYSINKSFESFIEDRKDSLSKYINLFSEMKRKEVEL